MKRKPDAMLALMALFFIGLIVSGFSTFSAGSNRSSIDSLSIYTHDHGQAEDRTASR